MQRQRAAEKAAPAGGELGFAERLGEARLAEGGWADRAGEESCLVVPATTHAHHFPARLVQVPGEHLLSAVCT